MIEFIIVMIFFSTVLLVVYYVMVGVLILHGDDGFETKGDLIWAMLPGGMIISRVMKKYRELDW